MIIRNLNIKMDIKSLVYGRERVLWNLLNGLKKAFFIKGHFRELRSSKYKVQKRIWIDSYEKGTGKKVKSIYKINRKKVE